MGKIAELILRVWDLFKKEGMSLWALREACKKAQQTGDTSDLEGLRDNVDRA